jgi:polyhydroxyalkanoate synthesis regulator phasin
MSLAFTPDGKSLLSGSLDRSVRLWDVASGRQVRELAGHRWRCDAVAVTPDGKGLISGGADGSIRIQDRNGEQVRRILLGAPPEQLAQWANHVVALRVTSDSKTLLAYRSDPNNSPPSYHRFDLATGKELSSRPNHSRAANLAPPFSFDGRLALEYLYEDRVRPGIPGKKGGGPGAGTIGPMLAGAIVRNVATGEEVGQLCDSDGGSYVRAFSRDGRTVLMISQRQEMIPPGRHYTNTLRLWEVASGQERLRVSLPALTRRIQQAAFAPDGRSFVTWRNDGTLQFWDAETGHALQTFRAGEDGELLVDFEVHCLVYSPDSQWLAAGYRDGTIMIWDARRAAPRPEPMDEQQLKQCWADLAGDDARRAYASVCRLAAAPEQAVPLLRERVLPAAEAPREQVEKLIADLESAQYATREAAKKQLTALDEQAGPALRAALTRKASLEQRRRIEQMLAALETVRSPDALRQRRAVETLERIGTPPAVALLRTLTTGIPEARLTCEAQASLERLSLRTGAIEAP